MIKDSDISVVVQGNCTKETKICLESIRKVLPRCEVILSTWDTCDVRNVENLCDKIILSKDPGAIIFETRTHKANNINRIIVSSKNGVAETTRKYILRMRSDLKMVNRNILQFKDNFPCRETNISLFKNRIFAYELFSIKFEEFRGKKSYSLFHISDWCLFGLAEDIKLFHNNIQVVEEPLFSEYFALFPKEHNKVLDIWTERMWKMSPEQHMISSNASSVYPELNFKHRLDYRNEVIDASSEFIVNNFIIKSIKEWGVVAQKDLYKNRTINNSPICKNGAWLGKNWLLDYQKFCNPNYVLPIKYTFIEDFHLEKYARKFSIQFDRVIFPIKAFVNFVCGILGSGFYLAHIMFNLIVYFPRFLKNRYQPKKKDNND